jgi:cytochrome c oxidase subunit 2
VNVLRPAGPEAAAQAELALVLLAASGAVFLLVLAIAVHAVRRPPAAVDRAKWIVGGGVLLPVVVLSGLLAASVLRSAPAPAPVGGLVVNVDAKMWWWDVRYLAADGRTEARSANEIRVPVGRPVTLGLTASEVIHSFWVPRLGGKVDMVPGRVHPLRFTLDRPGVLRGQCAEFCGEQHARMALHVIAMEAGAFDRWLAAASASASAPAPAPASPASAVAAEADAPAVRGRAVYLAQRCDACHTVRGVGAAGTLGPDLSDVGGRTHLGAGTLRNSAQALAAWVADPQAHKPGARMPAYGARLDAASLQALAAFLAAQR